MCPSQGSEGESNKPKGGMWEAEEGGGGVSEGKSARSACQFFI